MKKSLFIITLFFCTPSLFCSDDAKKAKRTAANLARFNKDFKPRHILAATKRSLASGLLTFRKLPALDPGHKITPIQAELEQDSVNSLVTALVHPESTMEFRSSLLTALETR